MSRFIIKIQIGNYSFSASSEQKEKDRYVFSFDRCPYFCIDSRRSYPLTRLELHLPDPSGELSRVLKKGNAVSIQYGYQGDLADWAGTIKRINTGTKDQICLSAVGIELPLVETRITQSFENETPEAIIKYAVSQSGLPIGRIDSPGITFPRFVASDINIFELVTGCAHTCQKGFDINMSRWALWLGKDGVNWGDFTEPGSIPTIATGDALLTHLPGSGSFRVSKVDTFMQPSLSHSHEFKLHDQRRDVQDIFRTLATFHVFENMTARTHIYYGEEYDKF